MRIPLALRAVALSASLLLLASCRDDAPLVAPPAGPSFNHVRAQPGSTVIGVNALRVYLDADALRQASRGDVLILYHGGLAFGTGDTSIIWFDTRNGFSDLAAASDLRVAAPGAVADHQTVSLLTPVTSRRYGPNTPPPLLVVQETFAFAAAPDDDYVIVKYTLFNPGPTAVAGIHAGQVLDQDVGPIAGADFVQYSDPDRSVRQFSQPGTVWTGHVMLGEDPTAFRTWVNSNGNPPNDDPNSWAEIFGFLSGGMAGPAFTGPSDVRNMLGSGPFTLGSGMSRVVAFALIADDSWDAVGIDIAAARTRWNALPASARGPYPIAPVALAVVPQTIQMDAPGPLQVHISFASAVAPLFDAAATRCAGARPTRVLKQGARLILFLERSALDPNRLTDGTLRCGGYLTDGTAWTGAAPVTVTALTGLLAEPAIVTRLTTDPGSEAHASWSPDGQSLVFDAQYGGVNGVWRMDLAGGEATARLLVPISAAAAWPDWSPDGSRIVFTMGPPGGLFTVPPAGGVPTRIGDGGGMPAWSRDGMQLAFARNNTTQLWAMDVASGVARIVATEPSNMYPEWGPDGLLYFVARGRSDDTLQAIVRVDPTIGSASVARVTPIEGAANFAPSVAPDGRTLVFVSNVLGVGRQVVFQDLRTGEHTVLRLDLPNVAPGDRIEFSPDGRRLAYSYAGDIYVAALPRWAWRPGPR